MAVMRTNEVREIEIVRQSSCDGSLALLCGRNCVLEGTIKDNH